MVHSKDIDICRVIHIIISMMLKPGHIICILAFALLIQNTCPHGFAGKTSIALIVKNCSMKNHHSLSPDVQEKITAASMPVHLPLFVFAVPKTIHTFQLSPITTARPVLIDPYKDALPDELLRPPQA
jgi:hypothetical protein